MEDEKDGFPITSLWEITLLKTLKHPNIINMRDVSVGYKKDSIFLIFDYFDFDLLTLFDLLDKRNTYLTIADIKCIMLQLLKALEHLHSSYIIHRDIKCSNILLNRKGTV